MHLQSQPKLNEKWLSIIFIASALDSPSSVPIIFFAVAVDFLFCCCCFSAANYFFFYHFPRNSYFVVIFSFVVWYLLLVCYLFMNIHKECLNTEYKKKYYKKERTKTKNLILYARIVRNKQQKHLQ